MRYATILIGLSLLYAAWHLHTKAVAMTDKTIHAPYTVDNPCPRGMDARTVGAVMKDKARKR